jgi:NADH:ubiquinone reductase (H+-translocating)
MSSKNKIVVLGGGFAAVAAARAISKDKNIDLCLVAPGGEFVFVPILHEIATGGLSSEIARIRISSILPARVRVLDAYATAIDSTSKKVSLSSELELDYDILVVATGGRVEHPEDFTGLRSIKDALFILDKISKISLSGQESVITVAGGGPTGVELALEIAQFLAGSKVKINIVQSGGRILKNFPEEIARDAVSALRKAGIEVILNKKIISRKNGDLLLSDGSIVHGGFCIWTAGLSVPHLEGLEYSSGGLSVDENLRVLGVEGVFGAGDVVSLLDNWNKTAQCAVQMGEVAGLNALSFLKGRKLKKFIFKKRGELISLGKFRASGVISGVHISGFLAWFIWRTVYLLQMPGLANKLSAAKEWTIRLFRCRSILR